MQFFIIEKASKHQIKIIEEKFNFYLKSTEFEDFKKNQIESFNKSNKSLKILETKVDTNHEELWDCFNDTVKGLGKFLSKFLQK